MKFTNRTRNEDFIGKTFDRWTIVSMDEPRLNRKGEKKHRYICKCVCGKIKSVNAYSIRNGISKSCGCIVREQKTNLQHGLSKHPMYSIWIHMVNRCHNSECDMYKLYGARGIRVCNRWRNSVDLFIQDISAIGERPSKKHSLDRVDNDKGYYLGNVKWSTQKEQTNNTRRNHYETYNGETLTLSQWADKFNMPADLLYSRILGHNMPIEKALTYPRK